MEEKILFSEQQHFRQIWLWLLMAAVNASTLYGAYAQIVKGKAFGNHPIGNNGLLISVLVVLLITILIFILRLDTQITDKSIQVRFFPFQRTFKIFSFDSIDQMLVRKYSPLKEYGGWGIRYGANGKAYNMSGSQGIQLVFKKGDNLLIGTNQPQEVANVLESLKEDS